VENYRIDLIVPHFVFKLAIFPDNYTQWSNYFEALRRREQWDDMMNAEGGPIMEA